MISSNNKALVGVAIFTAFVMVSCINTEYTGQSAYGDAFIKSAMVNDSVVGYNLQLYAYSWSEMKSVNAYSGNDDNLIALDTIDYKYTFAYQPYRENFSPEPPAEDDYYFRVTFDNDEQTVVTDYLSSLVINPPHIKALEWDDVDKQIKLQWDKVENAQIYSIALLTDAGQVAFESEMLDSTITEKWINQLTYGWHSSLKPTKTSTYKLVIRAFLFEPVASTFDIQCMAVNDLNKIEWKLD